MFDTGRMPLEIDLLVVPETNLILIASVIEPLRAANRISGSRLYSWRLLTPDGAPVETTCQLPLQADGAFRPGTEERPLFVVASYNWRRSATPAMRMALSRTSRYRAMIAGIESGTWLLAEASLLERNRVTVHWEDFDEFSLAFPQISVARQPFVIDGKRMTTAGSLPTVDLMLEIIKRRQGYSLALEVSRLFSYAQKAPAGELPMTMPTVGLSVRDVRVAEAVRLMEETIDTPLTMARLARRVGVSARHLQSLFQDTFSAPPHIHYLALRLNAARRKVIETRISFADIAAETGFNSASAFARSYRASYGESPSQTRRRLSGEAGAA